MFTLIQTTSEGFILPRRFVEGVLVKDGAIVVPQPSKYDPQVKHIVVLTSEVGDVVVLVDRPIPFHTVKASKNYQKTWLIHPKLQTILELQNI